MRLRESDVFLLRALSLLRENGGNLERQMNLQILVFYCKYRLHRLIYVAGRLSWVRNTLDKISEWDKKIFYTQSLWFSMQAFSKLAAGHIGILETHAVWYLEKSSNWRTHMNGLVPNWKFSGGWWRPWTAVLKVLLDILTDDAVVRFRIQKKRGEKPGAK